MSCHINKTVLLDKLLLLSKILVNDFNPVLGGTRFILFINNLNNFSYYFIGITKRCRKWTNFLKFLNLHTHFIEITHLIHTSNINLRYVLFQQAIVIKQHYENLHNLTCRLLPFFRPRSLCIQQCLFIWPSSSLAKKDSRTQVALRIWFLYL